MLCSLKANGLHLFVTSMLLLLCTNIVKAQSPFEGDGTSENPYKIYTAEDFGRIREYPTAVYEIMNDIDMYDYIVENFGDAGWMPIEEFRGSIDGKGHMITGMNCGNPISIYAMFRRAENAIIRNLGVEYNDVNLPYGGSLLVHLAINTDILGCFVKAKTINITNGQFAPIVTVAYNCSINRNTVIYERMNCKGLNHCAGLCAVMFGSQVINNSVRGDIVSEKDCIGGIIAQIDSHSSYAREVKVCSNKFEGNVYSTYKGVDRTAYIGGLLGDLFSGSSVNNICHNLVVGNVKSVAEKSYTGGLCGIVSNKGDNYSMFSNVVIADTISSSRYVGYISSHYEYIHNTKNDYSIVVYSNKRLVSTVKIGTDGKRTEDVPPVTVGKKLLMTKSTYTDMGWDFDNYWEIEEGKSYPNLKIEKRWLSKLDSDNTATPDDNENVVDTDISTLPNTTYISNFEVNSGKNATISLKLKNSTINATGFQCDICIPKGCRFLQDSDGFYLASLSTKRTTAAKTNYFDCSLQDDGALRILCNSTKGYAFSGTDGEVATIDIAIPADYKDGTYPVYIKNIRITEATGSAELGAKVDTVKLSMLVSSYELGDANGDGEISVNDFSAVANYILGNTSDGFIVKAADVNSDEEITVNDLSGIAYYILNGQFPWTANEIKQRFLNSRTSDGITNKLYITPIAIQKGETMATLSLNMLNDMAATGFQCDIYLPEGFSFAKDEDDFYLTELSTERTTPRKTNYFDCALQADGSLRILCNSTGGYAFEGSDGEVATIAINIDSNVKDGVYKVIVRKGELADKTGNNGVKIEEDVVSDITYGNPVAEDVCNVQISSLGIATYCSSVDLDFTDVTTLKAYIASGYNKKTGTLLMSRVYDVPAGMGILLMGEAGNYEVPVSVSASSYSNMLKGVTIATTISPSSDGYDNYILADGTDGIGFYPIGEEGTIAAGKAYLQLPKSASLAKCISIQLDETTGITNYNDSEDMYCDGVVYDLTGRVIKVPTRGLYIINGKKVFVR